MKYNEIKLGVKKLTSIEKVLPKIQQESEVLTVPEVVELEIVHENTDTDAQKMMWQPDNRNYNSTRWLEDASYLRLKDLTLSYNLPKSLLDKLKIQSARIYFKGQNMWTLTNFSGWDPEVNRDNSYNTTQGVTYLSPPQIKTAMVGLNITI